MPYEKTSNYYQAALYAWQVLKDHTPRYLSRLQRLSPVNTLEELTAIIDFWATPEFMELGKFKNPPDGDCIPGARWGDSIRVECVGGIVWNLRCKCGQFYERSTNDTVPTDKRKCPQCIAVDLTKLVKRRHAMESKLVCSWYRAHARLIRSLVRDACKNRGTTDQAVLEELNATVWAKIDGVASHYHPHGHKVTAWLGTVANNCITDYFRVSDNRKKLAPTSPIFDDRDRALAVPPTDSKASSWCQSDTGKEILNRILPAKPVRPEGAGPDSFEDDVDSTGYEAQNAPLV